MCLWRRPLSDLGQVGYVSYWSDVVVNLLADDDFVQGDSVYSEYLRRRGAPPGRMTTTPIID